MSLSVVVLTKNEEKNIEKCINSVLFADEIIVIDDYSEDKTTEKIKALNNKQIYIFQRHLQDNFSEQRNFALEKCKSEWVLFLDADEEVTNDLKEEIQKTISNVKESIKGISIKRRDIYNGKELKHGEWGTIKLIRLARRDSGKWEGSIHETWQIGGEVSELQNFLYHYPHQSLTEFLNELNFYTSLRANELFEKDVKSSWLSIVLYTKGKFFQNFILRLGFLDGIEGIIYSVLLCFHSFLVRSKLWLLWQKK